MSAPPEKKPYAPNKGSSVNIQIDLNDFVKKVEKRGALVAIAETVYNLSLLANDHLNPQLRGASREPSKHPPKR